MKKIILLTVLLTLSIISTCLASGWEHVGDTHWSYDPHSVSSSYRNSNITGNIVSETTGYTFTMTVDSDCSKYSIKHINGNNNIDYSDELGKVARAIYDCYKRK